ncbi:uncharacterized protein LOC656609 [Tribolium castaneum]|uniref:F-box domain-containing protein n=1 Tax=Tribolium castaneum TaxID=7070 RepID=D2A439_TRICA|nr:PREDICTED: uncharacterized protein LOC656609 [Tribolium castaneum]EFA05610.1 hypothetical protein TcasGA2_TC015816 [Tribolium castaneum]|eukprot:XP_976203.1 PREDICTED: uncharacterized protein LOC656609 [Tribolium castaneum]
MSFAPSLLDLPNCVILQLLQYLDATTLYLLGRTCVRLDEIIRNSRFLWKRIDARRSPNDRAKVVYCLERCNRETHTFLVRGDNQGETLVPDLFYSGLNMVPKMKNIVVLALENQTIHERQYSILEFPPRLEELSLRGTVVAKSLEFFKASGDHFQKLRVLILDECAWVTSIALMSISKYPALEILSLYKCKNIDNSIPYLSLSGHGFKQLRIFDARLSPLGNTLIRSIYKSPCLLAIYLQNDDISYALDHYKRELAIKKGAPTRTDAPKTVDLADYLTEENGLNYEQSATLDDRGLLDYLTTISGQTSIQFPVSLLYLDPYNDCTCQQDDKKTQKKVTSDSDSGDDDDDDDQDSDDPDLSIREISAKIARLARLIRRNRNNVSYGQRVNHDPPWPFIGPYIDDVLRQRCLVLGYPNSEGREDLQPIIDIRLNPRQVNVRQFRVQEVPREIRKRFTETSEGPQQKKPKADEALPGPSGLQPIPEEVNESDNERAPSPPQEPPYYRRVFFRGCPVIQIENLDEVKKDFSVPLKRLSLRGYKKITNTALHYIKDLELELLDVTYTSITKDAIENYLVEHPSCRVLHEQFCTCPPNLHF